jgi:hypothetical protein
MIVITLIRIAGLTLAILALALVAASPSSGATAPLFVHGPPADVVASLDRGSSSSTNWSGYATQATGTTFTDVQGTWVQPAATCSTNSRQYASFWVGLDGYNSSSVEQIGTDADCAGRNRPVYYAWYEMYPAAPVNLSLPIHPGDSIAAEVSASGSTFTLNIENLTTGDSFSVQQTAPGAAISSAEWVAEAPSSCMVFRCKVLPLANFGTVNFSGSYTTGSGHTGSISDPAWSNDRITMVTNGGTIKALPSALSPDGTAFSVAWKHP